MNLEKFTVQFRLELVCSNKPDVGIETLLQFELEDGRKIILINNCYNFINKYSWDGDTSSNYEKEQIKKILNTDLMIDVITDYKNSFLMSKLNDLRSNLYMNDEKSVKKFINDQFQNGEI
jgi:hypothetical protein